MCNHLITCRENVKGVIAYKICKVINDILALNPVRVAKTALLPTDPAWNDYLRYYIQFPTRWKMGLSLNLAGLGQQKHTQLRVERKKQLKASDELDTIK